jgi:hypothetical protein
VEKSIPAKSLIQIESIGKFLQDVWLGSFFLLFFSNQTSLPTPFVWLGILIVILLGITLLFNKIGYQIAGSVVISIFFACTIFAFNGPFWLYALIVIFAIWRIQERFSKIQEDATNDGFFFTLLVILFSLNVFLATAFQNEDALKYTSFLTISGILVFILERMIVQWLSTRDVNHLALSKVVLAYLAIIGLAGTVYYLISSYAHWTRVQIFDLLGGIITTVLYPIGMFMEWLTTGMYGKYSIFPEKSEVPLKGIEEIEKNEKQTREILPVISDFPWIIIGITISVALIIFLIWRFSKNKREESQVIDEGISFHREVIRHSKGNSAEEIDWSYSMETNIVRDAYREFEKVARESDYSRQKDETVREWFKRQSWDVSDRFYSVYDVVRYSQSSMNSQDGEWFIQQLASLSIKYFQKEV